MGLHYADLEQESIRQLMLDEVDADVAAGSLYLSDRLNAAGRASYPQQLRSAIERGSDDSLAEELLSGNSFEPSYVQQRKNGPVVMTMPKDAHLTLSQGEFNRFYIRAVCRLAIAEGRTVVGYRARASANPRPESEAIDGKQFDADQLLADLRTHVGVETALGLAQPNSGMSVRLS